jgi:hypothetical protein
METPPAAAPAAAAPAAQPMDRPADGNLSAENVIPSSITVPQNQYNIPKYNEMFYYIFNYIYPNIVDADKIRLINEFSQLNDNHKYKLISGILDPLSNNFTPAFTSLIQADYDIAEWGRDNHYDDLPTWKGLLEELAVIQIHSLTVKTIEDLFKLIANKLRTLNKIIETDRNIIGPTRGTPMGPGVTEPDTAPDPNRGTSRFGHYKKYLKYKQKYLKLKNELSN